MTNTIKVSDALRAVDSKRITSVRLPQDQVVCGSHLKVKAIVWSFQKVSGINTSRYNGERRSSRRSCRTCC